MTYRGDQEPSILTEPVELTYKPHQPITYGYFTWAILMHLMVPLSIGFFVITKQLPGETFVYKLILVLAVVAAVVGLAVHSRQRRTSVTIYSTGIVTRQGDQITQNCRWEDTQVVSNLLGVKWLADASGRKFPLEQVRGKRVLDGLARQVIRTQLRRAGPLTLSQKTFLFALFTISAFAFVASVPLQHSMEEVATSLHKSLSSKLWIFALMSFDILTGYTIFFVMISAAQLIALRPPKPILNPTEATDLVESKKGRLNPANLDSGGWFRYVRGLDTRKATPGEYFLFIVLSTVIPCVLFLSTMDNGEGSNSPFLFAATTALYFIVLLAGILDGARSRAELRRGLPALIRGSDNTFTILGRDGETVTATPVEALPTRETLSLTWGVLSWKLRGSDSKIYRFDPRYLIPVESEESSTSELSH